MFSTLCEHFSWHFIILCGHLRRLYFFVLGGTRVHEGAPVSAIRPMQLVQNAVAYLVFNHSRFSHTTLLHHIGSLLQSASSSTLSRKHCTVLPLDNWPPCHSKDFCNYSSLLRLFSVQAHSGGIISPTEVRRVYSFPIFCTRLNTF